MTTTENKVNLKEEIRLNTYLMGDPEAEISINVPLAGEDGRVELHRPASSTNDASPTEVLYKTTKGDSTLLGWVATQDRPKRPDGLDLPITNNVPRYGRQWNVLVNPVGELANRRDIPVGVLNGHFRLGSQAEITKIKLGN
jgi:hypothetical protein